MDKFIGNDTGAPLQGACFILETDDGKTVEIIGGAAYRRQGVNDEATMTARVRERQAGARAEAG